MPLVCLVNGQTTPKRIQPSAACSRAPTESCPPPTGTWPSTFAARSRSLRLRLHRPRVAALGQAHRAQGALHAATLLDLEAGGPALPFDGRLLLLGPVELLGEHLLVIPLGLQVLADGDGVFPHLVRQPEAAHLLVELAERLERPRLLRVAHVEAAHIRLPRLLQELERVLEVDLARLLALRRVALRLCHCAGEAAQKRSAAAPLAMLSLRRTRVSHARVAQTRVGSRAAVVLSMHRLPSETSDCAINCSLVLPRSSPLGSCRRISRLFV
mmetsp:Transcript_68143/g.186766  ORF Transcript_68143/g.186766 Transcript_68143/m.186766 type:complete len:270 (+) Transcript_68143:231-1040(+)